MVEGVGETMNAPLGVSAILPTEAVARLRRAAREARNLPEDDLERRRVIDRATRNVKLLWPEFFVQRK